MLWGVAGEDGSGRAHWGKPSWTLHPLHHGPADGALDTHVCVHTCRALRCSAWYADAQRLWAREYAAVEKCGGRVTGLQLHSHCVLLWLSPLGHGGRLGHPKSVLASPPYTYIRTLSCMD